MTTVWARRNSRPAVIKQTRYKWLYLFGAVNPDTGESCAMIAPAADIEIMNIYLSWISEQAGADRHIVLALDQAAWHTSAKLRIPNNITLLHLPPYSPELNPIERLWHELRSKYLSNRVYEDHESMFAAATAAFNAVPPESLQTICRCEYLTREN